jgi:hypothetical protein
MLRWIPISKGASSKGASPQSDVGASEGLCFGFGPTLVATAARVTMVIVLVVVVFALVFMLISEAVVPGAVSVWVTAGSPSAARENMFKATSDDRMVSVGARCPPEQHRLPHLHEGKWMCRPPCVCEFLGSAGAGRPCFWALHFHHL